MWRSCESLSAGSLGKENEEREECSVNHDLLCQSWEHGTTAVVTMWDGRSPLILIAFGKFACRQAEETLDL